MGAPDVTPVIAEFTETVMPGVRLVPGAIDASMLSELRAIHSLIGQGVAYLQRLVELEEGRREGERHFEALAEALQPSNAEPEAAEGLDWYCDRDGVFRARVTDRRLTDEEIARVTYSPRREAQQGRSR